MTGQFHGTSFSPPTHAPASSNVLLSAGARPGLGPLPHEPYSLSTSSSRGRQLEEITNNEIIKQTHVIPRLTRIPKAKVWEQVVRDWENADSSRSLYVAMKDWHPEWHRESNQTQIYGQRQTVALEFIKECVLFLKGLTI